jgi:serine/alanine racemase
MLLYVIHPAIIVILRGAAKAVKLSPVLVEQTMIQYILVCALSVAAVYIFQVLTSLVLPKGK